jgi:D-alanyl-D-alanine carboxypeptidase/D-alanyl-D-alanine-endopeptidase (penicillin-binding protein 4)
VIAHTLHRNRGVRAIGTGALTMAVSAWSVACAGRATVPAPTAGHRPEPVAPVVMPVAEVRTPPSVRAIVEHLADSAIAAPMWRNARWGALIVDATTGDTVYAHDADRLFMPASNQKLLTSAIAMQALGPEYRWRTPVLLRGTQRGTVFYGDVAIIGRGDPTVSDSMRSGDALSAFDPIADALAARKISRIVGQVVSAGNAFGGPTTGFGWEIDDLDAAFGAPVDELLFNEGLLRILVRAGRTAGAPALVTTSPTMLYPAVRIDAVTRAATDTGARLRAEYDSTASTLVVSGTIALGDSARLSASYRHPNDAYLAAIRQRLAERKVMFVAPPARRPVAKRGAGTTARVAEMTDTLVVLESPPLRDVLPRMLKPSQNQIAEMLFHSSALAVTGDGGADSARAVGARTLAALGVTAEHAAYRDGSGLSRHDYVSPRALVRVLDAMQRAPWGDLYRTALPLAAVDGTIANRMRNTAAAGNANAKTGTVDKARALSGYVRSVDGHLFLFSLLCNSFTVPTREVDRVQDLIVATLAGARAGQLSDMR